MRVRQLRAQCQACGELVGCSLRHDQATPDTPEVDTALLKRSIDAREQWAREREQQREDERAEWQAWYAEYLTTEGWREKRRRVLRRARGICEGCGEAPAEQVHHLTYEHAGDEFLWELVAICRRCHARYHEVQHG